MKGEVMSAIQISKKEKEQRDLKELRTFYKALNLTKNGTHKLSRAEKFVRFLRDQKAISR